jgi:hypothetical protein
LKRPGEERDLIDVIGVDAPLRPKKSSNRSVKFAKMLGRSDMPVVEVKPGGLPLRGRHHGLRHLQETGATCKAGTKTGECPQKKPESAPLPGVDTRRLVGIDQPFSYKDVVSVTG